MMRFRWDSPQASRVSRFSGRRKPPPLNIVHSRPRNTECSDMSTSYTLLPPVPQTRDRSCTTFCVPPLDGSLTFPQLIDFHGQESANHRFFVYAEEDGTVESLTWFHVSEAVRRGALLVKERLGPKAGMAESTVVAILSPSDSIPYATTIMGIMRAGYVPFPISTRNSPAAIAYLLEKTSVQHLFVGLEQAIQTLTADTIEVLKSQHPSATVPTTSPMPVFGDLYGKEVENVAVENVPYEHPGLDKRSFLLHSSGSTAFPKPIPFTHRSLLQFVRSPLYGERDLINRLLSLHSVPMSHAMGIIVTFMAAASGQVLAVPAPKTPPTIPTADLVIRSSMATNVDLILTVPSMVESWSQNPECVTWLGARDGVVYAGGPLNKERGDYLVSQGTSIFNLYASTECGPMNVFLPSETGDDWEYFRFASYVNVKLEPYGNDEYEAIFVANEFLRPNKLNTKIDEVDAYSTSDLVAPHPTKKGLYKIVGRTDDQIMHSTGEKTNPGPLETMMNQDQHVQACVMFGRGQFQAGILVEPKPEYSFDSSDEAKVAEFRNKIWPTILKMNAFAPQHSRLFKEMILVANPSKPFSWTAKRTVRRGAVTKDYENEINALYDSVEASSQSSVTPPASWDIASASDFVRRVAAQVMNRTVPDDDDLFQHGCDSLQATYIRNTLLRAVRHTRKIDTRHVPESFVYENPTVTQLSSFMSSVALGIDRPESAGTSTAARVDAMHAMVAKYTAGFPTHSADPRITHSRSDVILVTGTTGSLGSHLLSQLAVNEEVEHVYALNRPSMDHLPLRERQRSALVDRGLDASVLDSDKVVLLEGDLTKTHFGVGEAVYEQLRRSVTHIIHNAWRVDFVIALSSFDLQVQGLRSLIDFALSSPLPEPPRLIFESSMAALQGTPPQEFILETCSKPEYALGMGYAESKWVSEQILFAAAEKTALSPLVARLGQICGGPDGVWNAHEWFPSIVQSAPALGCFPDDARPVDWIPLDLATATLIDFRKASSPTHLVHLVHPCAVSWHTLAVAISAEFGVLLVPYATWLSKLEQYAAQSLSGQHEEGAGEARMVQSLRALQLLPMFRGVAENAGKGRRALGLPYMDVSRAKDASPTLADPELRQLSAEDVHRWLAYWRKVGLLCVRE
ncbi:acetyl-CoA synthetase-like protein [Daedalea quercina L-15889]|uniref:Acetyl-CoA synthetase-like protein n=1 Tax=Daedalea quercina L-15889 TaxID=1314783 RepID=A0A165TNL0_9APHY|nr:acetyl-CoA synthetase-like protein [Daedalea quercina L-15889]